MVTLARRHAAGALCAVSLLAVAWQARAQEKDGKTRAEAAVPRLHHAPPSVAVAHRGLLVFASIDHPERVRRALVVYTTPARPSAREVEFRRGTSGPYVAELPAADMRPPWFDYAVELELGSGERLPVFASRSAPHRVAVPEPLADVRERALDARLGGRRSVSFASADYVDFGNSQAEITDAAGTRTIEVRDRYYRIEAGYTYRPLRTVMEFSLKAGVVRGQSPVPSSAAPAPGQSESDRFEVGLNYGAPTVRFRVSDIVHLEAELLTSVTEVGFSVGTGGALLVGDPYGTRLTLGMESIQTFGTRVFTRLDVGASERVTLSPVIEISNMPHAEKFGLRLLAELGLDLGAGFGVAARGGYQARTYTEGGPSAGATVSYAF